MVLNVRGRFIQADNANRLASVPMPVRLDDFGVAIPKSFLVTEQGGERPRDVARELIAVD